MAKISAILEGDLQEIITAFDKAISNSISASHEDEETVVVGDVKHVLQVYERFSWVGSSRLSLTLSFLEIKDEIYFTAISSGGSQAVFMKINTWGETAFINKISDVIEKYEKKLL